MRPCHVGANRVGIVDVPGHERFIRNMVAGATGMDITLLVIAADDGVMPQTREHLDIAQLLGVQRVLTAITKTDLVSPDRIEEVRRQIETFLEATRYAGASITPCSSVTGEGLTELRQQMDAAVQAVERKKTSGMFRLPIDRIFTSEGHGVVVTGIAISGSVKTGETVDLLPSGKTARVRSLQVYLGDTEEGIAGQCVALNLTQLGKDEFTRGGVLASPERFSAYYRFTARVQSSLFLESPLRNSARIRFHTGTSETRGKLRLLNEHTLDAGQETFAQIELEELVPAFLHDRFILRLESPPRTVAGGTIIECGGFRRKRFHEPVLCQLRNRWDALTDNTRLIEILLEETPFHSQSIEELAKAAGVPNSEAEQALQTILQNQNAIILKENRIVSSSGLRKAADYALDTLIKLHAAHPARFAFTKDEIRAGMQEGEDLIEAALARLLDERRAVLSGASYRGAQAVDADPQTLALAKQIERLLLEEKFKTSSPAQLVEKLRRPVAAIESTFKYLVEKGAVVRLTETVYLHNKHVEWAKEQLIKTIQQDGFFETHLFKTVIGSSRKYAIPLLDHFDATGVTRRIGGKRYLQEKK